MHLLKRIISSAVSIANNHAGEFVSVIRHRGEIACLEYIDKYDDFYNIPVHNWSPIMYMIYDNYFKAVKILIKKGADVNHMTPDSMIALKVACAHGYVESAVMLIKAGASFVNIIDTHITGHKHIMLYVRYIYGRRIKAVMDDDSSTDNMMAQCFRTTYVPEIVDMIAEFII